MGQYADTDRLSPDQRRHELAVILATGLLRFVSAPASAPCPNPNNLSDSARNCLEVSPNLRLSVQSG
jgi:hypothetical protein